MANNKPAKHKEKSKKSIKLVKENKTSGVFRSSKFVIMIKKNKINTYCPDAC